MVGWPLFVPSHGPYKVVAVKGRDRDVRRPESHGMTGIRLGKINLYARGDVGSRPLTVMTLYGPWEGTNNGHPTMILTGMTHGDYQPALHPPPSDLGKFSPLLANHHHQSTSMAFPAAPSMGHEEAQTLATTTTHSLL